MHVSTDEVYGSIDDGSWPETHPLRAELALLGVQGRRRTCSPAPTTAPTACRSCITRCSNNYGPHQFPEKVIPLFVTNLLDGAHGAALRRRAQRPRLAARRRPLPRHRTSCSPAGRAGEIYNIGGGTELTNRELTDRLLDAVGAGLVDGSSRSPTGSGHDRRYSVDWTKIAAELGYAPRVPFDEGARRHRAWYRDNRDWWEPLKRKSGAIAVHMVASAIGDDAFRSQAIRRI